MSKNIDIVIQQFKSRALDNRNEQHYWETRPNPNSNTLAYMQKACECAEYHEYIAAYLEELKTRRAADKWISVKDRLPDEYGNYLVFTSDNDIDIGTFNPQFEDSWSMCDANGFYWVRQKGIEITCWKPLPKAPESEADHD